MSIERARAKDNRYLLHLRLIVASLALLLCVSFLLSIVGCKRSSGTGKTQPYFHKLYMDTLQRFDQAHPGFGLDVLFTAQKAHHPKAYALFASAEVLRFRATGDPKALDNALRAARWLVENSDLDEDGEVGWGFPFPWDAGGDGSVNPAHTEYTIDTAVVIQALLDVYDVGQQANLNTDLSELLVTAVRAAETFTKGRYDEDGSGIVFWYSTALEDSYHVINVSAMMAAVLQRLSHYNIREFELFAQLADRGIQYVLAHALEKDGIPYWLYFGDKWPATLQENRPNDLQHEAYIVQSLLDYKRYSGKFGDLIDPAKLLASLQRFVGPDKIYELPLGYPYSETLRSASKDWARLWGVGYALHVARQLETWIGGSCGLSARLAEALVSAYYRNGLWFLRPDSDQVISYPRQLAFVLLGLGSYALTACR